jgi:uncharacterized protein YuzE
MTPDIKLELDPQADAAYVLLTDGEVASTKKLDACRLLDLGADGEIIGIEFLHVSAGVDLTDLPLREELHRLFEDRRIKQIA